MKNKLVAGLVAAGAIVAMTAAPAFAADYVVDGTTWTVYDTDTFGVNQFSLTQNTAPHGAYSGDGHMLKIEDPSSPGSLLTFDCASSPTTTTQEDGDFVVDCEDPTDLFSGDLAWDGSVTIFSGDYRGIVGRLVYTLTNTTANAQTLNLSFEADTEECNSGSGNVATSSGDLITATDDIWMLCNNDNAAIEGFAWGNNWMTTFTGDDQACDVCNFDNDGFVLAANSSVTFVFFLYSEGSFTDGADFGDTDANIIANATGYFDTTTLGASRLWEGLTTAENWTNVVGSAPVDSGSGTRTLPTTGVDVSVLLISALGLVGIGAVIVVRRRTAKA